MLDTLPRLVMRCHDEAFNIVPWASLWYDMSSEYIEPGDSTLWTLEMTPITLDFLAEYPRPFLRQGPLTLSDLQWYMFKFHNPAYRRYPWTNGRNRDAWRFRCFFFKDDEAEALPMSTELQTLYLDTSINTQHPLRVVPNPSLNDIASWPAIRSSAVVDSTSTKNIWTRCYQDLRHNLYPRPIQSFVGSPEYSPDVVKKND